MGKLVSTKEVADEIGVARQTVSRWVREGVITPARRTAGGQSRFDLDEVKRQLKEHLGEEH
ncbi:helix-turn-helix domain-containing protein [Actinopolyspora saharensis]|nr:helix-turn-helix domain-containing protein [Actinopolyspora saharensis]